jgi:hypothetical protein
MARTATTIEAIMRAQAWLANAEEGRLSSLSGGLRGS